MNRRGPMVAVAALALVALVFAVLALHRGSNLAKAVAATAPSFPPAVSASSVPVASASASAGSKASATASASSSASPTSTAPARPVVAFLGDGYTGGDGGTSHALRWTTLVAADFGWTERNFAFGGTGYSTAGTQPGGSAYTARTAAVAAARPTIVIVSGGRYDIQSTNGPTQIKAGVTATFTALRAELPSAAIIAESPVWSSTKPTKPPATLALVAADVKAAVTAVGGRYLDIGQPLVGVPADISSNPALPNDAGYAALAKAFETAYDS